MQTYERIWRIICHTPEGQSKVLPGRWLCHPDAINSINFLRRRLPGCLLELMEDFQ